jgi:hypothetical protein
MTLSSRVEVGDVGKGVPELGCRFEWYSSSPWLWSVVKLRVGLLVGEVHAEPLSHAVTALLRRHWWRRYRVLLAMARCHYWIILTMTLSSRWWLWCCRVDIDRDVMSLSSLTGDDTTEKTLAVTLPSWHWPWRESLQSRTGDGTCTCRINKLMHGWSCTLAR